MNLAGTINRLPRITSIGSSVDQLTSMAVFVKSVDSGSLAAAARHFGLSNGMVSKHIHGLERRLGVRLLNLTTRHLSLTEVGQSYYWRCQQILNDVAEADTEASTLQSTPRGTLRLSAPLGLGELHLGPAIADFMTIYPDISVDAELSDRFVNLVEEGFDVAIRIGQLLDSTLVARRLGQSAMLACASPDYLARHGTPMHPSELTEHDCYSFSLATQPHTWWFDDVDGNELSVQVTGRLRSTSMNLLVSIAQRGLGIIFGPSFMMAPHLRAGVLQPILLDYPSRQLEIFAIYPSHRHLSSKVRVFVDFLLERFGHMPSWNDFNTD